MAPIRNRSQAAGGVGKKVHRKARPGQPKESGDSWTFFEREGLDPHANNYDDEMGDQDIEQALAIEGRAGVDEAVTPLREMAERVGKEVEMFAETLDDFLVNLPTSTNTFDAAHDLVLKFKRIADNKVDELYESHAREAKDQLRREWSQQTRFPAASGTFDPFTSTGSSAMGAKKAGQVKQLRQWQQEADIWELFRIMLELHPFEADAQADREGELAKLGVPNRYTTEGDLWVRFLAEDNLGNERYKIKTWLEQTADRQASDIQSIVEELETKAGRGKGLWSSSWMHTRERIKAEKRLRSWPNAADSPLPQIRRSDNNELLVTTLDPDAPHRQQRTLEKDDSYFERAIWVACWEMLRRGKSPQEICNWCEDRKEGWRALCMGKAFDNTEPAASSVAWRHACQVASQSGSTTDYEAAVFGLLGGNIKAVEKVCRNIDDHLYAYYSTALLRQFDQYVLSICPDRVKPTSGYRALVDGSALDPDSAQQSISDLISRLRRTASTSSEAVQPMKIIQSFLLADEVGSLIHTVGAAIAEAADFQGLDDDLFFRTPEASGTAKPREEVQVALDMQTLRIVTHMSIIHRVLSPDYLTGVELFEDENVTIAYVQALRAAGKRLVIPSYASKLRKEKYIPVLARMLQDITDNGEQKDTMTLLQKEGLDTVAILTEQLSWIIQSFFSNENDEKPLHILQSTEETKLHPGQRIVVDFLPDWVNKSDEALGKCLEWYRVLPGNWKVTFDALTLALRRCLVTGRFACARMICQNFPYKDISERKSYATFHRSVNVMDPTGLEPEEESAWRLMKRQSRTFYELQQLIRAVEALYTWRTEEHKLLSKAQRASSPPSTLKKAKDQMTDAMEPILCGILLHPLDEAEAEDLRRIRLAYLPEIVIAYNTVLHAAGNLITRDALLESMDLSTIIANERDESGTENGLAKCFVQAGRMRELVSSFALTSKLMLVLKAEGKPWKAKKDREGRDLGMWELQAH